MTRQLTLFATLALIVTLLGYFLGGIAFLQQRSNDQLLATAATVAVPVDTVDTVAPVPVVEEVGR